MAEEFDAFDTDFGDTDDFELEEGSEARSDKEKEKNPFKLLLKKFLGLSRGIQVLIVATPIIVLGIILLISVVSSQGVPEQIKTPYYYPLEEYTFKLDEFVNGRVPYVRLKLELVFDDKFRDYKEELDRAAIQIQNEVIKYFRQRMTYQDIEEGNFAKRQDIYNEAMEYINRMLDEPIVKEIMEVKFEAALMRPRY
jgi:flagellar basal body-associated protein FliL